MLIFDVLNRVLKVVLMPKEKQSKGKPTKGQEKNFADTKKTRN
jgi:hypothetical protein